MKIERLGFNLKRKTNRQKKVEMLAAAQVGDTDDLFTWLGKLAQHGAVINGQQVIFTYNDLVTFLLKHGDGTPTGIHEKQAREWVEAAMQELDDAQL